MAAGMAGDSLGHWTWVTDGLDDEPKEKTGMDKPPYRVPLMSEVAALPRCGLKVVSTFSGCGGSCLGFRMAGYEVLWASEFVPAARETYAANWPSTTVDARDIRTVRPEEILASTGLRRGELDVLEGSPPCASFSTAGKRHSGWGEVRKYSDVEQRTDDLFFEYVRILRGLAPKAFVAENVSGLVKGVAKGYFIEIMKLLKASGYRVSARLLDAQWLGVPQARQRIIFVGVRRDLGVLPVHPRPLPYRYSIREAIPTVTRVGKPPEKSREFDAELNADAPAPSVMASGNDAGTWWGHEVERVVGVEHDTSGDRSLGELNMDAPINTINCGVNSVNSQHWKVEVESRMEGLATGDEWDKMGGPGTQSDKYFQLVRPDPETPTPTITAAGGNPGLASVAHPTEKRKFTIAELKRLCAFPDDFKLTGTYAQQWERLGRAVPPVMAYHVAKTLKEEVFDKLK